MTRRKTFLCSRSGCAVLILVCAIPSLALSQEPPDADASGATVRGTGGAASQTGDDWLDWTVQYFQIGFFTLAGLSAAATASVAWLTFFAATKGWLSPINAEYRKRMMDRFIAMSDDLYAELSTSSDCHWVHTDDLLPILEHMDTCRSSGAHLAWTENKRVRYLPLGTTLSRNIERQLRTYRSDPFLPAEVRQIVVTFLTERGQAVTDAYGKAVVQFVRDEKLMASESRPLHFLFRIVALLNEQGFDPQEQLPKKLDSIRDYLHAYLEGFDPRTKKARRAATPSAELLASLRRTKDLYPDDPPVMTSGDPY